MKNVLDTVTTEMTVDIDRFSHDGRGIAYYQNKILFLSGGFPGERVQFKINKQRSQYSEGEVTVVLRASPQRVQAQCPHFGVCGGCALQTLSTEGQRTMKQAQVADQLSQALGEDVTSIAMPPIAGSAWHYRRRARLSVKYVAKKGKVLVGFRERQGRYVADIDSCAILSEPVGSLITPLSQLVAALSIKMRVPQIEIAVADNATALVIRHLDAFTSSDFELLTEFSMRHQVLIYTQAKGPESVQRLVPVDADPLYYELNFRAADKPIRFIFQPTHFIQINRTVNQSLIEKALEYLDLKQDDTVLDLFCGLGNISLPLAKVCKRLIGVEGEAALIAQARDNAKRNNIENVEFYVADLTQDFTKTPWYQQNYTTLILDPPRVGAMAAIQQLAAKSLHKIMYISCNPATFARDAQWLKMQGYHLKHWGVADMFPHTHHVEVIALFSRE